MTAYALDHVAIAVQNWSDGGPVLAGSLGGRWRHGFGTPAFNPCQISYGGNMRVELLEPAAHSASFIHRFLDQGGGRNRPHHITFKVDDIQVSLAAARAFGMEPILVNVEPEPWKEAFLHPRDTGLGFLAQIVQSVVEPAVMTPKEIHLPAPWPEPEDREPAALPFVVAHVADLDLPGRVLRDVLGGVSAPVAAPPGWTAVSYRWGSGADLVLATADDLPDGPGIRAIGVEPALPAGLPSEDLWDGWRTTPLLEPLGISLIARVDQPAAASPGAGA